VKKFVFKRPLDQTREDIEQEFKSYREKQNGITATFSDGDLTQWSETTRSDGAFVINIDD
jgi:hypothetical protein